MHVAITCCIMTCSISKGFVTYHGSMECEINVKCESDKGWSSNLRFVWRLTAHHKNQHIT